MDNSDYSISLRKANIFSILLLIPLSAVLLGPYGLIWGWLKMGTDLTLFYEQPLLFLMLMIAGIVAHELIHGITWIWFGGKSWNSLKFGVNISALAPYAHCREPLEIGVYRWGAAMPGLLLGVIPFLVGLVTGNGWFTLFGYLLTITASGDLLILWLIRNIEDGTHVLDHPTRAGCQITGIQSEIAEAE